jgi:hypothetical protein
MLLSKPWIDAAAAALILQRGRSMQQHQTWHAVLSVHTVRAAQQAHTAAPLSQPAETPDGGLCTSPTPLYA